MESVLQIVLFISILILFIPLLGKYMAEVFKDNPKIYVPILSNLETLTYRICHINPHQEMTWKGYTKALLSFNAIGFFFLFFIQIFQDWLPLNPQGFPGVSLPLAFNTAASFTTNTGLQAYGGEITLSYFSQMGGIVVQNFTSPATGNAVLLAFIRGIQRKTAQTIGNFWIDLIRTIIYLLLPLSIIFSLFLVSQGVIQNINPYVEALTLEGEKQIIPMGPVASQVAIKQLGTNGGGFFNANSAHPFENPTPLSNFLQNFAIFLIPASATYMYGTLIKSKRQGWVIFIVMAFFWLFGLFIASASERVKNPLFDANPILEGKEVRVGSDQSVLWAVSTTSTSNGSINSMHSSLSPLAGGVAMFNIMIVEVAFGGVGVGLCSMLIFVLFTVFIAGLMVGRTPEYLFKKIEKTEIKWSMLAILTPSALVLIGSGLACLLPEGLKSISSKGPHGLSEVVYAFLSAAGNNGSCFAGLNLETPFYTILLGSIMILGRTAILIFSLIIAGSLAQKKAVASSLSTLQTDKLLFCILLIFVIFVEAALTFFPALSLGPYTEQILMLQKQAF